jgi:DNA-sulfur modification-associated
MKTKKSDFEEVLIDNIQKHIKKKSRVIKDIKTYLADTYGFAPGEISNWINNPQENIPKLDVIELYLINEQVFHKTGNLELDPKSIFTEIEEREAKIYHASSKRDSLSFPIILEDFSTSNGIDRFSGYIDAYTINQLLENQLLIYDYKLQREAVKRKLPNGEIRTEPKIVKKNLNEIEMHLKNNTLEESEIWFNAQLGSSDSGIELDYNPNNRTVVINPNTKLAVGDGFHRCRAVQSVLRELPNLDFKFRLYLTNFTINKAQNYQVQMAQHTKMNTVHIQSMASEGMGDRVVSELMLNSDLKRKVASTQNTNPNVNELVSFKVLSDAIESEFDINSNLQVKNIAKYLSEFFDTLIGTYPDEFITNISEVKKVSLINDNNMFTGFVALSKKMRDNDISIDNLEEILNKIDFSRNNQMWRELNILDEKGRIEKNTKTVRNSIKNYFKSLDLEEMKA